MGAVNYLVKKHSLKYLILCSTYGFGTTLGWKMFGWSIYFPNTFSLWVWPHRTS